VTLSCRRLAGREREAFQSDVLGPVSYDPEEATPAGRRVESIRGGGGVSCWQRRVHTYDPQVSGSIESYM
jgi:hypothetical protein